jgi:hypothetical protein
VVTAVVNAAIPAPVTAEPVKTGCRVTSRGPDEERPHRLSHKYVGHEPPPEPADVARVIARLVPEKVIGSAV